jgi:hypothetical protein
MALLERRPPVRVLSAPVEQRVRHACWATIAILVWSFVGYIRAAPSQFSPWHIADFAIPVGLVFLYWRRTRFAALALPGYFVAISLYQLILLHQGIGYFQLAILGWFLARGSAAIFEGHRAPAAGAPASTADAG